MNICVFAKVKEFTEFWRDRLNELYEIEKSMPPLQGDELIPEIKREFCVASFFIDREEQDKDRFFTDVMLNMGNAPLDLLDLKVNAEIIQEWINHIRYLRELKHCVESDNATFKDFEYVLDSAFDYFIGMYRKGLEEIKTYLSEHASEHDGYQIKQIKVDVSDIVRDVEKAVDKAGEL